MPATLGAICVKGDIKPTKAWCQVASSCNALIVPRLKASKH
jgi:hypothetical protein